MAGHVEVRLGIRSPRADCLVRLEIVGSDPSDGSLSLKIVPCDADGRTRPDDHPSPEIVRLSTAADVDACHGVMRGRRTQVAWLRCGQQAAPA